MEDLRQSSEWASYMAKIGWEVADLGNTKAYIRKIPFLGSIIKIPRFNDLYLLEQIDTLAKKQKAFAAKIEPNAEIDSEKVLRALENNGYYLDNWSFAPTRTIRVDLTQSEDRILANMKKETRYAIRKAQGLKLELGIMNNEEGLEEFINLYKQTAKRTGFWTGPIKELRLRWEIFSSAKKADLFLASQGPALEAGAVVFYHDKVAYYYHAASSESGQKLNAPSLLIWEIIRAAKKRHCLMLDLEGIKDSRIPSTKNWEGFSRFKKGFGGQEIELNGSFSKYYVPLIGPLFRFIQKLGI